VGFGDYLPSGDTQTVLTELELPDSCANQAELISRLPRLPNTAAEVEAVGSYLGAGSDDLYLQTAFSRQAVTRSDLEDYRVIYFATHGLMPYRLSCLPEPALTTSRVPSADGPGRGLLLAGDVVELRLDADLVVLSACDTGGPAKQTGGEALTGLARAFFYSGARSMLVTHWEIPDQPTVDIMTGTFQRMSEQGLSLARALQESQKEMIHGRGLSHPIVWGAFNVVGDGALKLETGPSTTTTAARATESAPM
jgi:CHAT domain-containing protein